MLEKAQDLVVPLKLTLKSIKTGMTKEVSQTVQRFDHFTGELHEVTSRKTVKIQKGIDDNDEIVFPNEGNDQKGKLRGNLVFRIHTVIRSHYLRQKENIIIYHPIHPQLIHEGFDLNHKSLIDGEILFRKIPKDSINLDDPQQSTIIFFGKGLPKKGDSSGLLGDIHVIFIEALQE